MHTMQKYILDRLRREQPLSYSQMLPKNTESSHFMYHLRHLVGSGLVQKESRGVYSLTHDGKAQLEYMSADHAAVRMPKVITYTLLTCKGQQILLRKQKEPYRNLLEPVAGKIHFGEDAPDAAQREVFEKLGIKVNRPVFVGVADILISHHDKPLTHMTAYAHVLELKKLPRSLPAHVVIDVADSLSRHDFVPGALEIIDAIQRAKRPFFITIRAQISS